jgi:AbrB family looped-hinge helix DNA binding protein
MTITVSSKGQVTLPAEARRRLGIHTGTKLEVIVKDDDRLEIVRVGDRCATSRACSPSPGKLSLLRK